MYRNVNYYYTAINAIISYKCDQHVFHVNNHVM